MSVINGQTAGYFTFIEENIIFVKNNELYF